MSIVNSDLISDALREIGVLDETESASAEQGATGLRKLNQMMAQWEESDVKLGYYAQTVLSDTCPIPVYAEVGVTTNLAIKLAPTYGAQISVALAGNALDSYLVVQRTAMNERLPEVDMQNRPFGEGYRAPFNILTG